MDKLLLVQKLKESKMLSQSFCFYWVLLQRPSRGFLNQIAASLHLLCGSLSSSKFHFSDLSPLVLRPVDFRYWYQILLLFELSHFGLKNLLILMFWLQRLKLLRPTALVQIEESLVRPWLSFEQRPSSGQLFTLLALRLFLPEVYWSQFCFFTSTFG